MLYAVPLQRPAGPSLTETQRPPLRSGSAPQRGGQAMSTAVRKLWLSRSSVLWFEACDHLHLQDYLFIRRFLFGIIC